MITFVVNRRKIHSEQPGDTPGRVSATLKA